MTTLTIIQNSYSGLDFATTLKYRKPPTETSQGSGENDVSDITDVNNGGAEYEHREV